MRPFSWLTLTLLLVLSVASPALGRVATIQTTAPLQDHAEQSIKTALLEAVETAVKGAAAMGFSWVKLGRVLVLEEMVAVQIVARDTKPQEQEEEGEEGVEPGQEGELGVFQPAQLNL